METLENSVIIDILRGIIEKNTYFKKVDNHYEYEMYVDYRDGMQDSQLIKISQSEHKMDAFYDELADYELQCIDYEMDELMQTIERNWDEEEHSEYDEYEEIVRDWVQENVYFNFPFDHYLETDVRVNILVDSGDGNHDFTLNNFVSYNAGEDEEIEEESSILWLVRQQGYTKEDLYKLVRDRDCGDSKFLKSVYQELINVTSHMNALGFFVKMSLKEYIDFSDNKCSLILDTDTSCGLYDCWSGAGGMLDIELEKPVVIPVEYIEAHIEGARGYGVDEIYGMINSFWTDSVKEFVK